MRCIVTLAFALLVASAVTASDFTQAESRDVESRLKNCSQIVSGRLGAIYSEADQWLVYKTDDESKVNISDQLWDVVFSPCFNTGDTRGTFHLKLTSRRNPDLEVRFDDVVKVDGERIIDFAMPQSLDETATITATYTTSQVQKYTLPSLKVVAHCPKKGADADTYVPGKPSYKVAIFSGVNTTNGTLSELHVTTVDACARFPFTNKGMPAGGIAALIVVILACLLQFGAYWRYHTTRGHEYSPLDMEQAN